MPDYRYPKLCFDKLRSLDQNISNNSSFNWFSQVKAIFHSFGRSNFWHNIDLDSIKNSKEVFLQEFRTSMYRGDCDQLLGSSSLLVLPYLPISVGPQNYFKYYLSNHKMCIYAQIRFFNYYNHKIITTVVNKLDINADFCPICGLPEKEDIFHALLVCAKYSDLRLSFFGESVVMENIFSPAKNDVKRLIQYTEDIMLIRYKFLNDVN